MFKIEPLTADELFYLVRIVTPGPTINDGIISKLKRAILPPTKNYVLSWVREASPNNKIAAIKCVRGAFGLQLKEAKEWVEGSGPDLTGDSEVVTRLADELRSLGMGVSISEADSGSGGQINVFACPVG